ncbi:MAG: rRNA maturation RNase YbeY [Halioglobus sp.]
MNLHVDIQTASAEPVPDEDDIRGWIAAALNAQESPRADAEISLRLVDTEEMTTLNATYRGKQGPTNVLSFPAELPGELQLPFLGDIVICAPVVRKEADEQSKTLAAHWAHMAVHGTLHLLGYDHENDEEAAVMEALESRILNQLDFACPYSANESKNDSDESTPEHTT